MALLIILICSVPAFLFRKKISYLFCPETVMWRSVKHRIFVLSNLLPSIVIAGYSIARLRLFFEKSEGLQQYENFAIGIGFIILYVMLYISGIATDKIIYHSNSSYKNWKDSQTNEQ